jgi:hypothetical protein
MAGKPSRPQWVDRALEALRVLAGVTGEIAELINAVRNIR